MFPQSKTTDVTPDKIFTRLLSARASRSIDRMQNSVGVALELQNVWPLFAIFNSKQLYDARDIKIIRIREVRKHPRAQVVCLLCITFACYDQGGGGHIRSEHLVANKKYDPSLPIMYNHFQLKPIY